MPRIKVSAGAIAGGRAGSIHGCAIAGAIGNVVKIGAGVGLGAAAVAGGAATAHLVTKVGQEGPVEEK